MNLTCDVVPEVQQISVTGDETVFVLSDSVNLHFCDEAQRAYEDLTDFLEKAMGITVLGGGRQSIVLVIDSSFEKTESYRIKTDYDSIYITASDGAGALYAVQTLKQLLLQNDGELAQVEIFDYPEYAYRGFMLDCGRYFFSVEAVKAFLDAMVLHKLNRFHWHLTEDQGWRVEVYSKLLLAQVGGFRAYTNFGRTPHGGFYSKEDIEEIIAYAHERFIKVIAEIDQPGHSVAAIAAYPFLSCFDRELTVATNSGIHYDVLCPGKESTFEFMFGVLDEICEMLPDKIIHIGADEVPTERWEHCPHCKKRMEELGLKSAKELHTYYVNRVYDHLKKKGFQVMMWNDSSIESKVDRDIVWQVWNGDLSREETAQLINSGRKVVNSVSQFFYLDFPYGHTNLKKCYEYEPFFEGIDEEARDNFLGAEACLWTEYVPTMKKAGYCAFPRLGAFCESVWTKKENKSFARFEKKLPVYYKMLDTMALDYAKRNQAMPSLIRKLGYNLWWERRRLHWQGLHNIIDNKKVKKLALKQEENK